MPNIRYLHALLAAASLAGSACASDTTAPSPVASSDVQGTWSVQYDIPGSELPVALQESSGAVQGTGTWAGEAGLSGAVAVSGTIANDSLDLRIILSFDPQFASPPDTAKFEGRLATPDQIDGVLTRDSNSQNFELIRFRGVDPPCACGVAGVFRRSAVAPTIT